MSVGQSGGDWMTQLTDNVTRETFEEVMQMADVSLRELERHVAKLRNEIDSLYEAPSPKSASRHYQQALRCLGQIVRAMQTPKINQWRQQHSAGRGKRNSQQHILECKLAVARQLLAEHGIDLDAQHIPDGVTHYPTP